MCTWALICARPVERLLHVHAQYGARAGGVGQGRVSSERPEMLEGDRLHMCCDETRRRGERREAALAQDAHCGHLPPAPVLMLLQRGDSTHCVQKYAFVDEKNVLVCRRGMIAGGVKVAPAIVLCSVPR